MKPPPSPRAGGWGCTWRIVIWNTHVGTLKRSNVQTDILEARKHLATAKEMIERMGYHRRDKEVVELEKEMSL